MTQQRWQQIDELFHAALSYQPAEREAFLARACGGDESLRLEVESLISSHQEGESFIATPAGAVAADMLHYRAAEFQPGHQIENYTIVRPLGSGGMGEVYLAQDSQLGRNVAIKILPATFTLDAGRTNRFVIEARAASALNHPNIITVHEIGKLNGTQFMVTEFVEGQTLRELITAGPLKLSEALEIAIQVGSALEAAHAARIVHRDIKPENIMVRPDGVVKVLDFGLAKLIKRTDRSILGLEESTVLKNQTAKGVILGTVNYMSPEQAKGERADERTDIFSLGIMIYELVAGVKPFAGNSATETLANLINTEPATLARFAADAPDELQRITSKTLRKDKDARYQTMKGLLADLRELREKLTFDEKLKRSQAAESERATVSLAAITGDLKHTTAGLSISQQLKKRLVVAVALVTLVLGASLLGLWYFARPAKRPIESIAVLPFQNESGSADLEYLSDGMAETLISNLSQLPNLDVKARSSVFRYKGKATDAKTIARELNVQAFLNGRVRQRGSDLSLFIELVDAQTEKAIWSQTYNRQLANLVSLQTEIALDVSERLRAKLSNLDAQRLAKNYTTNPEAYQLYLRGNYHVGKRTEPEIRKGIAYLEQAVSLDANYALGYAALASAYTTLPNYSKVSWPEVMPKVREATNRALTLDNDLSEAHTMLAFIKGVDGDDAGAEREYRRAIELNPNSGLAYHLYGQLLFTQGKIEEAIVQQRRAMAVEPVSLVINREYGSKLLWGRKYDEAIAQFKKTIELEPGFASAHYGLAIVYQLKGNYADAVEEQARYQELIGEPQKAALLREGFAKGGWQGFLKTITDERNRFDLSWDDLTTYYAALGNKDKAFVLLNKRFEGSRRVRRGYLVDPRLDPLRSDPRFDDLLRRAG